MENKWNKKNALWQVLYVICYIIGSVVVCVCGSIHPIFFVGYQVTAGILLTGVLVKGFYQIQAFGVALSFSIGILLIFMIIGEFTAWHTIPVIFIGVLAEMIGLIIGNNKWNTIVLKSVIMSFSTFGYYGQIWLNRNFTYECAVEEMPAGYADTLMNCSPLWVFPIVIVLGIVLSILIANFIAKKFKFNLEKN